MVSKAKLDVRKAAVKDYLTGTATRREVAERHDVPLSTLAMWLKAERGNAPIAKKPLAEDDEPMGSSAPIEEAIQEAYRKSQARIAAEAPAPERFELLERLLGENARLRRLVQTLLEMQIKGPE